MEKADRTAIVPWSVTVNVEDIPEHGLHIAIEAPVEIRTEIIALVAGLASVRDLPRLSAVFDLTRRGTKVHVAGHVSAQVEQTCVVTLEPIVSDVEEAVDVTFTPAEVKQPEVVNYDITLTSDKEPPEPLVDGKVDIGALATEFLVLGIDPHPRKAGAEFVPVKVGDEGAHTFAALEALKKRFGEGTS